jgi:enolase
MAKIASVHAREILDSRGNPTIEVEMHADNDEVASAMVPSGASTGEHEALELRDGDPKRYNGKGVLKAMKNVNEIIAPKIVGLELTDLNGQRNLDNLMIQLDGTENKGNLGANAILGCSMAYSRLAAKVSGIWLYEFFNSKAKLLPVPMMNIINGGAHADSGLDFQEFMIAPVGIESFAEKLRAGAEIFHALKSILKEAGHTISVGDEGGFAPKLSKNEEALDCLMQAIEKAGYKAGSQIQIALDVASSEFFENGKYILKINGEQKEVSADEIIQLYKDLCAKYPIFSIEDGCAEDDFDSWVKLTAELGGKCQIVGDDFLVTNPVRLKKAIDAKAANSILIKLNQIGTVSETLDAINMAKAAGFKNVISHRSGETDDTFIADLAVGMEAGQIKTGSLSRIDRVAKYNQLLRIEERLNA